MDTDTTITPEDLAEAEERGAKIDRAALAREAAHEAKRLHVGKAKRKGEALAERARAEGLTD